MLNKQVGLVWGFIWQNSIVEGTPFLGFSIGYIGITENTMGAMIILVVI